MQIDRPLAKPHAAVTANDAEAFFLLMKRVLWDGRMGRDRTAALLEYRRWGAAFAERYRDDGFVRCAFLRSEVAILSDHAVREPFDESLCSRARSEFVDFLEAALRGEVRTATPRYPLQSTVGQIQLDAGLALLPDYDRAGPLFEAGDHAAALGGSRESSRAFETSGASAKDLLQSQGLPEAIDGRIRGAR